MAEEWGVSEKAIEAMETTASEMEEIMEAIKREIDKLEGIFEENENGLGAHSDQIRELIEELKKVGEEANGPVKKLVLKLVKSAVVRRAYLEDNSLSNVKRR